MYACTPAVCMHRCVNTEARDPCQVSIPSWNQPYFLRLGISLKLELTNLVRLICLVNSMAPPVFSLPALIFGAYADIPSFYAGAGGPNSSLQTFMAHNLPLSHCPSSFSWRKFIV